MKEPVYAPVSAEVLELLKQLQYHLQIKDIAAQLPFGETTLWKARHGKAVQRTTRLALESKVRELSAQFKTAA